MEIKPKTRRRKTINELPASRYKVTVLESLDNSSAFQMETPSPMLKVTPSVLQETYSREARNSFEQQIKDLEEEMGIKDIMEEEIKS